MRFVVNQTQVVSGVTLKPLKWLRSGTVQHTGGLHFCCVYVLTKSEYMCIYAQTDRQTHRHYFLCVCAPLYQPATSFLHAAALRFLLPRRSRTANCRNCWSKEKTGVNSSPTPSVSMPVRISAFVTCRDACPSEPERVCLSA